MLRHSVLTGGQTAEVLGEMTYLQLSREWAAVPGLQPGSVSPQPSSPCAMSACAVPFLPHSPSLGA